MRRVIIITALPLLVAACQGANTVPASTRSLASQRMPAVKSAFSGPDVPDGKGAPSVTWIFASNGEAGNVDVYSAKTLKMISQCSCTGVGLAVDPQSGDLAVGTKSATVTVWHVKSKQITLFATLNLSEGPLRQVRPTAPGLRKHAYWRRHDSSEYSVRSVARGHRVRSPGKPDPKYRRRQ